VGKYVGKGKVRGVEDGGVGEKWTDARRSVGRAGDQWGRVVSRKRCLTGRAILKRKVRGWWRYKCNTNKMEGSVVIAICPTSYRLRNHHGSSKRRATYGSFQTLFVALPAGQDATLSGHKVCPGSPGTKKPPPTSDSEPTEDGDSLKARGKPRGRPTTPTMYRERCKCLFKGAHYPSKRIVSAPSCSRDWNITCTSQPRGQTAVCARIHARAILSLTVLGVFTRYSWTIQKPELGIGRAHRTAQNMIATAQRAITTIAYAFASRTSNLG